VKAAVIGVGPHGRRIVEVLRDFDGVQLAAVVDRSGEALAAIELPAATARYQSDAELWARDDIALVCVATNGDSHWELAEKAMGAAGRYLFVAKPMACSVLECDRMLAKASATETRIAVDHSRRYAPVYKWLRERIASGDWGEVRNIWVQRPDIGLGCNATHAFDLVRFLTASDVRRVTGWVDAPKRKNPRGEKYVDPGGLVVLELAGEMRAVIAQIEDGAGPSSMEIDMTAARVRLDEQSGAIEVRERDLSVKPGPGRPPVFRDGQPPEGMTARMNQLELIRACLADLVSPNPLETDATNGRAAIEILVAAYLSHGRGNQPVALPLVSPEELELWLPIT
jgi:predicted dehydrogenase